MLININNKFSEVGTNKCNKIFLICGVCQGSRGDLGVKDVSQFQFPFVPWGKKGNSSKSKHLETSVLHTVGRNLVAPVFLILVEGSICRSLCLEVKGIQDLSIVFSLESLC